MSEGNQEKETGRDSGKERVTGHVGGGGGVRPKETKKRRQGGREGDREGERGSEGKERRIKNLRHREQIKFI